MRKEFRLKSRKGIFLLVVLLALCALPAFGQPASGGTSSTPTLPGVKWE